MQKGYIIDASQPLISKVILTIIWLIVSSSLLNAQSYSLSSKNKRALKFYHHAEESFKSGNNTDALKYLEKATTKDNNFIEAWLLKGDILTELKQNKSAIAAYEDAIKIDSTFFSAVYLFTGKLYFDEGLYKKSLNAYKQFLKFNNLTKQQKAMAAAGMIVANEAVKLKNNPVKIQPIRLDTTINKSTDEYVNFLSSDNSTLIFTRKEPVLTSEYRRAAYIEKFYYSQKYGSQWNSAKPWTVSWSKNRNVGGMNLTADGNTIYFTGCGWDGSYGGCDLYKSEFINNKWQKPVNLGPAVNSPGWESQPYVSSNGKYLFFSSTRAGGYGGSDIWMSVKLKNGQWSKPVNLGDSINTPRNEMAPFLYADDKTLLFSSDGWPGLGKQDIFISKKDETGIWSKAKNIGYPVNTKEAEINAIYSLDGKQAFISSNRNSDNYDIYQIPVYEKIKPQQVSFFKGIVLDRTNKKPLEAIVTLTDAVTGITISSKKSRNDSGSFLMVLEPNKNYAFNILAKGYLIYSEKIIINSVKTIFKEFLLTPIKKGETVTLENLYFDIDSSTLKPASFPELKKLTAFLRMNPNVSIEIEGHTDNSGNSQYNMNLSISRAKSVYDYLVKEGINLERLSYRGYGNTKPVADNATSEGKAKNRRVVITIR